MSIRSSKILCQHWVHSYEEDTPTEKVFRPVTFVLPPSRGRYSFELKSDGGLVEYPIGSTDRTESSTGTWNLAQEKTLTMSSDQKESKETLNIVSVTPEKLVIKK